MKAPTIILLTLAGFNGAYRAWTNPPQDSRETKVFMREIILDTVTNGLVIMGTEWLASHESKFVRALAWTPVITSALVLVACILFIIKLQLWRNKQKKK
jgi:hypothetical protein